VAAAKAAGAGWHRAAARQRGRRPGLLQTPGNGAKLTGQGAAARTAAARRGSVRQAGI
jgi:hypothetical protein